MNLSQEQKDKIDSNVFRYLSEACGSDVGTLMISHIAKECGCGSDGVKASLDRLRADGKVDYERVSQNRNRGFRFVVNQGSAPVVKNDRPARICPACGEPATDKRARFCFVCGSSLLSKKELLKERYMSVLPKISRLIPDSRTTNEILTVLGQVAELAFEGD